MKIVTKILLLLLVINLFSCRKKREGHTYSLKIISETSIATNPHYFEIRITEYSRTSLQLIRVDSDFKPISKFNIKNKKLTGSLISIYDTENPIYGVDTTYYELIGTTTSKKIWGDYKQILPSHSTAVASYGTFEIDLTKPID